MIYDLILGGACAAFLTFFAGLAIGDLLADRRCRHSWRVREGIKVFQNLDDPHPHHHKWVLTCARCGDLKVRRT